jgi:CRISPR-associated endonuclease/helicase Cas3
MWGEPTTFWGKLERQADDSAVRWHSLDDHCADVASVAEALLHLAVWRSRLARLAGRELTPSDLARLGVLSALHDIGKFGIGFQAKGRENFGPTAGHVGEALAALRHDVFPELGELAAWGDAVGSLLVAAICHHGRPHNFEQTSNSAWQCTWWSPRGGLDPRAGGAALLRRCRSWFPQAFDQGGGPSLPDASGFAHAFAGLVMLADWIGSDTRFFPFADRLGAERMVFARGAARRAVVQIGLDLPVQARVDPQGRRPFERISSMAPRPAQEAILTLPLGNGGSTTILEAETGSGKTEAALARFVQLFEAGLVDGLYFALPTRSAATQIHRRVHEAVVRCFADPPPVVLAVPGYLRVDEVEAQKLPPFEVLWPDQDRFRYRGWAAEGPKRYLVGCIVVGTIDQVLLSALMVGHAHLRAAALLRHLLVVDEVHASDLYMTRILREVLARHVAAGGHALLLSATLAGEARTRLLHPERSLSLPSVEEATSTPYPLLMSRSEQLRAVSVHAGADRAIAVAIRPWLEDHEAIATAALAAAERGAKVIVIKNTVADCLATQEAVERLAGVRGSRAVLFHCNGVVAPHHARFAREDRASLDIALEKEFGKDRAMGGCVAVATQTVEQSLDLDADVMFADLCPADVLLQRLGRLHRHARGRPSGFESPCVSVAVPKCRDLGRLIGEGGRGKYHHGLGWVYPDLRVLEATWRLLEQEHCWRVPSMCRQIVERCLHTTVLANIVREGGHTWREHEQQMLGSGFGQQRQAELNLVDWSHPYDETSFPDGLDQRITTRLGEGDRRVRFRSRVRSPFGNDVDEVLLRSWWAIGVAAGDSYAEDVTSSASGVRFRFGTKWFNYGRLGLRPETPRGKEASDANDL